MAFLVVNKGESEDAGKIFTVDKPSIIIGRRSSQFIPDIELNSEVISRRHVEILQDKGKFMLRDLGSTNGTMLDEDRILPGKLYELKQNSKIGLGVRDETARVVLIFRESETTDIMEGKDRRYDAPTVPWLKIDQARKEAWVDGKAIKLSRKKYELLLYLYRNAGKICSKDEIVDAVWPESKDPGAISDAAVDQMIHRLREKVEPDIARPARIISKKAFGYILVA